MGYKRKRVGSYVRLPKRSRAGVRAFVRRTRRKFQFRRKRRYAKKVNLRPGERSLRIDPRMRTPLGCPVPRVMYSKFHYTDTKELVVNQSNTDTCNGAIYSLNSLYDPDIGGVGHQPNGYDALLGVSGPYTKYDVFKTVVRLRFSKETATQNVKVGYFVKSASDSNTLVGASTNTVHAYEEAYHTRSLNGVIKVKRMYDNDNWTGFKFTVYPHELLWQGGTVMTNPNDMTGNYGGNPTHNVKFEAFGIGEQITTEWNMVVAVDITYYAKLYMHSSVIFDGTLD